MDPTLLLDVLVSALTAVIVRLVLERRARRRGKLARHVTELERAFKAHRASANERIRTLMALLPDPGGQGDPHGEWNATLHGRRALPSMTASPIPAPPQLARPFVANGLLTTPEGLPPMTAAEIAQSEILAAQMQQGQDEDDRAARWAEEQETAQEAVRAQEKAYLEYQAARVPSDQIADPDGPDVEKPAPTQLTEWQAQTRLARRTGERFPPDDGHVSFIGGTRSGKTSAAEHDIETAIENGYRILHLSRGETRYLP